MTWNELQDFYEIKPPYCGTGQLGHLYTPAKTKNIQVLKHKKQDINEFQMLEVYYPDKLIPIRCNRWHCPTCSKIKKRILFYEIANNSYNFNLDNHVVFTCKGKAFRKNTTYQKSYEIMRKELHKLHRRIDYDLKKVRQNRDFYINTVNQNIILPKYQKGITPENLYHFYINLNRAQANPKQNNPIGFAHVHSLTNIPFNHDYLDERIKKSKLNLGYTWTRYHNAIDYLKKDFWDKKETIIPYNQRLYTSTRGIKINYNYFKEPGVKFFTNKCNKQFIEDNLPNKMLPFEEYVKQFVEINNKKT